MNNSTSTSSSLNNSSSSHDVMPPAEEGCSGLISCHLIDCVIPTPELLPFQGLQHLALVNTQLPGGLTGLTKAATAWPQLRKLQLYLGRGLEGGCVERRGAGELLGGSRAGLGDGRGSNFERRSSEGSSRSVVLPGGGVDEIATAATATATTSSRSIRRSSHGRFDRHGKDKSEMVGRSALPCSFEGACCSDCSSGACCSTSSSSSTCYCKGSSCRCSSAGMQALLPLLASRFQRLEVLEVQQLPGLDYQGLAAVLTKMPALRQLYISSTAYMGSGGKLVELREGGIGWGSTVPAARGVAAPPAAAPAAALEAEGGARGGGVGVEADAGVLMLLPGQAGLRGLGWCDVVTSSNSSGGGVVGAVAGATLTGSSSLREVVLQLPGHVTGPAATALLQLPHHHQQQQPLSSANAASAGSSSIQRRSDVTATAASTSAYGGDGVGVGRARGGNGAGVRSGSSCGAECAQDLSARGDVAGDLEAALQGALPWACVRAVGNQWPGVGWGGGGEMVVSAGEA
jgi:hypothetical protein